MQNAALSLESRSLELIARDLLGRRVGDRIPSVAQYQERLGIGSGTVQARLRTLQAIGAVTLRAQGHRGTVVEHRDLGELWSHGRLAAARGVLPLPEAYEPVALAAVLRRQFAALGVPLELMYLHGSARRVDLVRSGTAHFAVLSGPAAQRAVALDPDRWFVRSFGPDTYNADGSMVVLVRPRVGADDRVTRVGIDRESLDHTLLTEAEFPAADGYVYAPYPHARLPALVAEGAIDAAVWHRTTLAVPLSLAGVAVRPLHQPAAMSARGALGEAVVVADRECAEVASVAEELDLSAIASTQDEILRSEVLPLY